jgi:D-aspartate ligase
VTPGLPPAVVLGGGPTAVPVCRSLGRLGVRVTALGSSIDPVRHSRYCTEFVDLGMGEGVQERWLEWLTGRGEGLVVLACNDEALELIAGHRQVLAEHGHRPLEADDDVVLRLLDKHTTYEAARAAGVPAPETILVVAGDDIASAAARLSFPVALKPRHSHRLARFAHVKLKVFLATDESELERHAHEIEQLRLDVLASEVIPGAEEAYHSYYTYIGADGAPVVEAGKHKLRQFPVGFGLATYHATEWDEETIELGRRFCTGVGVRGLACVEFKRDARDGVLKLIECNSRFTAGNEIVRHAGVDLAALAYSRAVGRPDPARGAYRPGLTMWHPVEDVRSLLERRAEGTMSVAQWGTSLLRRQHFPLFDWDDPMPSLASNARLPRRLLGSLRPSSAAPGAGRVGKV